MITRLSILAITLLFASGCISAQPGYNTEIGDDEMDDARIQAIVNSWMIGEITESEFDEIFFGADEETQERIDYILRNRVPTEAEIERNRVEMQERRRIDISYLTHRPIHYPFTPAAADVDLRTIERFAFIFRDGFVLDRMHGRVYYHPNRFTPTRLDMIDFSAELIEQDFDRLIQVIEKSGLRDWDEYYTGEIIPIAFGNTGRWTLGIEFSDGTMLRRSGSGMLDDFFPPLDQFAILTDFVSTIGTEIQERHNAEAAQSE